MRVNPQPRSVSGLQFRPIRMCLATSVLPFALGLVDLLRLRDALRLVPRFIMLPQVAFALAASHHSDLVGPGAAVLALQLDALCPALVVDAAPVLVGGAPPAPELPSMSSDPVGQHLGWETLPRTH